MTQPVDKSCLMLLNGSLAVFIPKTSPIITLETWRRLGFPFVSLQEMGLNNSMNWMLSNKKWVSPY